MSKMQIYLLSLFHDTTPVDYKHDEKKEDDAGEDTRCNNSSQIFILCGRYIVNFLVLWYQILVITESLDVQM